MSKNKNESLDESLKKADAILKVNRARLQEFKTKQAIAEAEANVQIIDQERIDDTINKIVRQHNNKYKPEYCEMLIQHGASGGDIRGFCAIIGICPSTIYNWLSDKDKNGNYKYPKFVRAKKICDEYSYMYWSELGKHGASGKLKGFNASAWIFTMKNKFGWRDRADITTNGENISHEKKDEAITIEFVDADKKE